MMTLFHQIFTPANVGFMFKGLGMTIVIAILATLFSLFFGTILALVRTYAEETSDGRKLWLRLIRNFSDARRTCCGSCGSILQ